MSIAVQLTEEERQAVLLALAKLSLERPGWHQFLRETAAKLSGEVMFDEFRRIHGED